MPHIFTILLLAVASLCPVCLCGELTYTRAISIDGRALAYADFNADTLLDVLAVSANSSQLLLYFWQKGDSSSGVAEPTVVKLADLPAGARVVGAAPADFNGDSRVDVLLTVQAAASSSDLSVWIVYGKPDRESVTEPQMVTKTVDQPTVLDYNADMVADFLVEVTAGHRTVFTGRLNENRFNNVSGLFPDKPALFVPNSNLFTDMTGDLRSDLLLRLTSTDSIGVVMRRSDAGFEAGPEVPRPPGLPGDAYIGQAAPVSLDNDELTDLALPACKRDSDAAGAAVRPGDLELDGRLDLLVTLRRSDNKRISAFLTPTGDCTDSDSPAASVRDLSLQDCPDGLGLAGSALADVNQDGGLDLLQLCASPDASRWLSVFHSQKYNEEGYFFRSLVLNGMCQNAYLCPERRLPVGLPVPGPCLRFSTERPEGGTRVGIGCQLSQSAYSQLDLPYLHFGLGQFSNYIDKLTVAIPYEKAPALQRDFTFIIPNSQLLVVPYPHDNTASWTSELFVRPFFDKQVLYVGVTLLGTCLIACAIAAVFQCLEYRRDKLERVSGQQGVVFDPSGR
uniref:Integrin_alpha2 domain-containing protein n=1 Tax=Macrostomum lignano TaxID=282301 RepID=A0A1I8HIH1_9PLAT